jgi:uncharacterized phage-associated protein
MVKAMSTQGAPEGAIDSVEFAKYIILRFNKANETRETSIELGETKLQKLLYICDGFILAAGINLIGEVPKAWNYGPVYPRVHKWINKTPDAFTSPQNCDFATLKRIEEINAQALVDKVILVYGVRTAGDLSAWSHRPGSPWEQALERGKGLMNSPIDKADMKHYFKGLFSGNT